jgi:hypothetical protein
MSIKKFTTISFKTALIGGGAAIAGLSAGVGLASKKFAEYGDEIAKASRRTGIGVEALSELDFVMTQNGASLQQFEVAIKTMQKGLYDWSNNTGEAKDVLAELGLTLEDLRGIGTENQFLKITDALSRVSDDSDRAAMALKIFGRSGSSLIPTINSGADGIEKLRKEARDLGITLSKDDAEAAERLTDTFDKMGRMMQALFNKVGSALEPVFNKLAKVLESAAGAVGDFFKQNKESIGALVELWASGVSDILGFIGGIADYLKNTEIGKDISDAFSVLNAGDIDAGFDLLLISVEKVIIQIKGEFTQLGLWLKQQSYSWGDALAGDMDFQWTADVEEEMRDARIAMLEELEDIEVKRQSILKISTDETKEKNRLKENEKINQEIARQNAELNKKLESQEKERQAKMKKETENLFADLPALDSGVIELKPIEFVNPLENVALGMKSLGSFGNLDILARQDTGLKPIETATRETAKNTASMNDNFKKFFDSVGRAWRQQNELGVFL